MLGIIREAYSLHCGIAMQWMTTTLWNRARKLGMHLYGRYKKDILAHKKASFRTMLIICYHVGKKDKSFTLYIQNKLFGKIHKTEIVGCLLQNKLNN